MSITNELDRLIYDLYPSFHSLAQTRPFDPSTMLWINAIAIVEGNKLKHHNNGYSQSIRIKSDE